MDKKISDQMLSDAANALRVQKHQSEAASNRLAELAGNLKSLEQVNQENHRNLDNLLQMAEEMLKNSGKSINEISPENTTVGISMISLTDVELAKITVPQYDRLETTEISASSDWNLYLDNLESYAKKNSINLAEDPFKHMLSAYDQEIIAKRIREDYTMKKADCDKMDYMIGSFCGIVSGLIDSFFVGMPGTSKLGNWTNEQTDKFVLKTAKMMNYKPVGNGKSEVANAIAFLEKRYKVNYDQATGKAAGSIFNMSMSNHHIKSIAHAPDLVGLLFSIVDQFSGTSHFLDNGRLIIFDTEMQSLRGGNFISKLYCGAINWVGHLISDVAGSSTVRRSNPEAMGSGIPMPLFELFQTASFGKFNIIGNTNQGDHFTEMSLSDFSVKVFEEGYDARFGMAQAIPVIFNELMIRFLWAMKSRFIDHMPWKECIPLGSNPNLRRVLLTGHGVLCLVDGVDAGIRSRGEILSFALHLNFPAWKRLAFSGILEVRAMYKENALDLNAMEKDLEREWAMVFKNSDVTF